MVNTFSLVAGALSLFSLASGVQAGSHEEGDTFNLYAYGTDIGGLPICGYEGSAYIVDFDTVNTTLVDPEIITFTISNGTWLASTNSSSMSDMPFYIPTIGSGSNDIGFQNSTDLNSTNTIWSGFMFYGHVAAILDEDTGYLQSSFWARETDYDGMWSLLWNVTTGDATVVTVKDTKPSGSTRKMLNRMGI